MTQSSAISPPSYLRAALSNQYNVILLAGSASFSAALASWAPLLSGLVGEAIWLVTGPRLKSFQRYTDATQAAEQAAPARISLPPPPAAVPPEYAERAANVEALLQRVQQACVSRND